MNKFEINDVYHVDFKYNYLKKVIKKTLKHEKVKNAFFSKSIFYKTPIKNIILIIKSSIRLFLIFLG